MSNSTVEAFPSAPVDPPSPAPSSPASTSPVSSPASSPAPSLPVSKSQSTFYISWFGIVGILAAFLVLVLVALVCFWHKRNAYRKALQEQRNFYIQNAARIDSDASDDEQQKRLEQMTLADWALPEWRANAGPGVNPCFAESPPPLDIPVYTRPKKVVPGSFRDKHMIPSCDSSVGDVFYTGEEGSQMGAFRFSRAELGSIEILTRVATPTKRKAENETASLLENLHRSHTIAATRGKKQSKWSLRTFSLPAKPSPESVLTSWGSRGATRLETLRKLKPLTPKPSSLPASPLSFHGHKLGHNLTPAPCSRKPSRLSIQSGAAFVPSTPPPPLPLPATVDEGEKTLKELRRELKHAESKWTIAPYCPSAPPPPLPVPFLSPPAPPPPPPLPRALPSKKLLAASHPPPPPPPPPPVRKLTSTPSPPSPPSPPPPPNDGCKLTPPPSPPPPPPNDGRKLTPPPSPPPPPNDGRKFTPPPSPPPSPPGSVSRPKLTPLTLPDRLDLREDFQRSSKRHQKMRPLHWDKLKPDSDRTVWDNISNSMELDEEMIENLFGVSSKAAANGAKRIVTSTPSEKNEILDPRKAHNIAIQLRARGLSRVEVCDALTEGDDLGQEILELLVKMSPTDEETTKFQEYQGDVSLLGPADRFILGILQVPNAFERLDAMLYRASFEEELQHIQETISTLEMACKELRGSRTFTKLLEAVLKTGNRLNMGTFRGDAKAFKLDTLLKLADVKGVDGKTTLLHFVIQEIIKAEGARAARMASGSACTTPSSTTPPSSPLSHFARAMEAELERCQSDDGRDDFRKIGMDVVRGIPAELDHVRKAGGLDILALKLAVSRLHSGLDDMKLTLEKLTSSPYEDDVFREKMLRFAADAEAEVAAVQRNLDAVLASVKDISIYFYGEADTAKSTQPLKVFVVTREFLGMLEQACKDVVVMSQALQSPASRRPSLSMSKS